MEIKEITEKEARERMDHYKELRDIKKEERNRTLEDKESISSLADSLEFPGFSDAGETIRNEILSAGEMADQFFEDQDREATDDVFEPQKEHEKDLTQRSEGIDRDIRKIDSKHLSTETAQARLDTARSSAEQSKEMVDKVMQEQKEEREKGEKDRDDQKQRITDTKVQFRG